MNTPFRFAAIPGVALFLCALLTSCATIPMDAPRIAPAATPTPADATSRNHEGTAVLFSTTAQGPLEITLEDAVLLALQNNRSLHTERLNPAIQRTYEDEERSAFEPVLSAGITVGRERTESRSGEDARDSATGAAAGLTESLPTGTDIAIDVTTDRTWGTDSTDQHASRAGVTITQALLQGMGLGPNLASLRQARLDTQFSEYELRGFAEALVAEVERTYWDYVLAQRQVEIFDESLKLAEQQLTDTEQRIRVGALAETELAASQAELALRREALINAHSRVATLRVQLLRLIQPAALSNGVRNGILPQTKPTPPLTQLGPVEEHVALALRMRPELNQARLLIQRGELELVKTRNGLLPRMDLFVTLGRTGYASSFGRSVGEIHDDGYDVSAGITFELPVTNREANARHSRATLTQQQLDSSRSNIEDLVREDVESAYIEVERTRQQVTATAATRSFQEESLRAETAKFRVGKSTALLVAQVQRDLVASQVAEVEAVTNHLRAITSLFRLDGSLLARRRIDAPGAHPIPLPE